MPWGLLGFRDCEGHKAGLGTLDPKYPKPQHPKQTPNPNPERFSDLPRSAGTVSTLFLNAVLDELWVFVQGLGTNPNP